MKAWPLIVSILLLFSYGLVACSSNDSAATPEELAAQIAALIDDEDWLGVKRHVTAEFAVLPDDAFVAGITRYWLGGLEDATWSVEQTSWSFAVAHNDVIPSYAYVFRQQEGEWRFDPGPEALFWAYFVIDEETVNSPVLDSESEVHIEGIEPRLARIVARSVFLRLDGDRLVYATQLIVRNDHPVKIDFRQVEWVIGGQVEPVALLWATGSEAEEGVFTWPATGNQPFLLLATDGHVEEGADVTLRFGGITVGEGEDAFTVRTVRSFQAQDWRVPR